MAETITSTSPDLAAREQCYAISASGAASNKSGTEYITSVSAAAITLAEPIAGVDDGKTLTFIDTTGAAHTVTTPTNGINGNKHVATFNGTLGIACTFRAFAGLWWIVPGTTGIALT